jgi:hypothetical protein
MSAFRRPFRRPSDAFKRPSDGCVYGPPNTPQRRLKTPSGVKPSGADAGGFGRLKTEGASV